MTFDHGLIIGVGIQPRSLTVQRGLTNGCQRGLVNLEKHAVADGLLEICRRSRVVRTARDDSAVGVGHIAGTVHTVRTKTVRVGTGGNGQDCDEKSAG